MCARGRWREREYGAWGSDYRNNKTRKTYLPSLQSACSSTSSRLKRSTRTRAGSASSAYWSSSSPVPLSLSPPFCHSPHPHSGRCEQGCANARPQLRRMREDAREVLPSGLEWLACAEGACERGEGVGFVSVGGEG